MIETIQLTDLKEIFQSDDFFKDLKELSSWASNIKQEAPILQILAKLLDRNGYTVALELKNKSIHGTKTKSDMLINGIIVEAKFCYEEDIYQKLRLLINKANNDIDLILNWLKEKIENQKSFHFQPTWGILKDIFYKNPDIFILISLSRNLMEVSEQDLEIINWTDNCLKYNKDFGYNNQKTFKILDEFLIMVKRKKLYEYCYVNLDVNIKFPSTYHIHLFDFRNK